MGMNYYWHGQACPCCKRTDILHIGKSSAGWVFALATHPDQGLSDLDTWLRRWAEAPAGRILDEEDREIGADRMLSIITERSRPGDPAALIRKLGGEVLPGPNGLLRHLIDGRFCIGHGAGTWDLMQGEFL